ncbi:hypothetical protein [Streptomyces sp. NPDC002845]
MPPETTDQDEPAALNDHALKAHAIQRPEWAEALIEVESARVAGEIRLLSVRLLLGTTCGSVLLFGVSVAARVAPGVPFGAATPLTTAVIGAVGAALVTAIGTVLGRALRHRSGGTQTTTVSGAVTSGAEPPTEPGSEPGAAR